MSSGLDTKCYDAFNKGRREEALTLLKQVKDPHAVKSKNNFTLLHCAAYHGWLAVVKELINNYEFDPDCMDDLCNTPISKARDNGKQPVVDYLETVIEKKCYDAFNKGRREEASRLLKQVKDPRTVMSNNNFTLLHCAAYHGWLPIVTQLINEYHFDPDCKDNKGNTPLSKARTNGKQPVVDYLEKLIGIAPTPPKPNKGNSREEETDQGYGRHRDLLMKSPELDDVFPLMTELSASWHDIGGKLRVPIGERESLLHETRISDDGKLEKILHKWISSQTSDVTWKKILDILVAFKMKNIASEVTSFLDTQEAYDKYACERDYVPFSY